MLQVECDETISAVDQSSAPGSRRVTWTVPPLALWIQATITVPWVSTTICGLKAKFPESGSLGENAASPGPRVAK